MSKTLKLNDISNGFVVEGPLVAVTGNKYKKVFLPGNTKKSDDIPVGFLWSTKLGKDEKGNVIWSPFEGKIKIVLSVPLKPGAVKILGKKYTLIEKEIVKDDNTTYKISVLQNEAGEEVGRYSKFYTKINGKYKFYDRLWMARFIVNE